MWLLNGQGKEVLKLTGMLKKGLWHGAMLAHGSKRPPLLVSGGSGVSERFQPLLGVPSKEVRIWALLWLPGQKRFPG